MGIFETADGCMCVGGGGEGGAKSSPLPLLNLLHIPYNDETSVIPYLKKIQKISESRDTPL